MRLGDLVLTFIALSKYPNAEVQGLDLSLIQPAKYVSNTSDGFTRLSRGARRIPPNLSFSQRDIESPWHGMDLDSWDLIHVRMLNGSISGWPETYQKIYRLDTLASSVRPALTNLHADILNQGMDGSSM